jgi:hypothetical protein
MIDLVFPVILPGMRSKKVSYARVTNANAKYARLEQQKCIVLFKSHPLSARPTLNAPQKTRLDGHNIFRPL